MRKDDFWRAIHVALISAYIITPIGLIAIFI